LIDCYPISFKGKGPVGVKISTYTQQLGPGPEPKREAPKMVHWRSSETG